MLRPLLLAALVLSTAAGCSRLNDRFGARVAPESRGPAMEGVASPSGMKIPAKAVGSEPNAGYWDCGHTRYEHAVRCALHEPVARAKR